MLFSNSILIRNEKYYKNVSLISPLPSFSGCSSLQHTGRNPISAHPLTINHSALLAETFKKWEGYDTTSRFTLLHSAHLVQKWLQIPFAFLTSLVNDVLRSYYFLFQSLVEYSNEIRNLSWKKTNDNALVAAE